MRRSIPTKFVPLFLGVPLGALAVAIAYLAPRLGLYYSRFVGSHPALYKPFQEAQIPWLIPGLTWIAAACGAIFVLGLILSCVRKPFALSLVNKAYIAAYVLLACYAFVIIRITGVLDDAGVTINDVKADVVQVFYWRWDFIWPAGVVAAFIWVLQQLAKRRQVIALYGGATEFVHDDEEKVITGRDPLFRRSVFSSLAFHVAIIVVIPWIMQSGGCVEDYLVPGGSGGGGGGGGGGGQKAQVIRIMKAKQAKKKKYVTRPNSAIYFHVPDLDESQVVKEVEQSTEVQYTADRNDMVSRAEGGSGNGQGGGSGGGIGTGNGKGPGGWPEGSKNAVIRFIRLEYRCTAWDDGMDSITRADLNFLAEFKKITGFKVADHSESNSPADLRKYRKGFAPPFLYMTGEGPIDMSVGDTKYLRDFLLDGSLLFVDCGSPSFDQSFRAYSRQLFPGERLVEIADDDPIFQMPFVFPNGAPPLWHHGGMKCMGIKHDGRWVVFYFPGDMNDAWKTGHNGVDSKLVKESYQMGVNIVYYSFTRYLEATRKYRK